jgi:hypothetical protein
MINNSNAVSISAKKKYPYSLLTDDYDILSENDLGSFTWGIEQKPFSTKKPSKAYTYWQCFPRELVMVSLSDNGQSASELGWKENVAYLEISVLMDEGIQHVYHMRSIWSIKDFQKRFNKWLKLMEREKYICLEGEFTNQEKEMKNGKTWTTYGWTFEKLKTKKGCDSYFDSCNPSYAEYLREKNHTLIYKMR